MGDLSEETQRNRTPHEVAGYPAFTLGPDQTGSVTTTGTGAQPGVLGAWPEPGVQTTRHDQHDATNLFGTPLPDASAPAPEVGPPSQGGYTRLGTGRDAERAGAGVSSEALTERLPIYDAVLSQWFASTDTGPQSPVSAQTEASTEARRTAPAANSTPSAEAAPETRAERTPWTSPGDDGWLAAQALLKDKPPTTVTDTGLPKRVPKAQLVPGSASPRTGETAAETTAAPQIPPRSANVIRGRMASFQQGVRRGRHAVSNTYFADQPEAENRRHDEEHQ